MKKIIYTLGFTQKTAENFFGLLEKNKVQALIDTRINPTSQLSGFAKQEDLKYFLDRLVDVRYYYRDDFAPTKKLLKDYRDKKISWGEYEHIYNDLIEQRGKYRVFIDDYPDFERICILCSEDTPEKCHRRLLAEKLEHTFPNYLEIIHL